MRERRLSSACMAVLAVTSMPLLTFAQDTVHWTTNFYAVTGANFREIRQSIARSRPWKDGFDGDTRWEIRWKFNVVRSAGGRSWNSFTTTPTITTTLGAATSRSRFIKSTASIGTWCGTATCSRGCGCDARDAECSCPSVRQVAAFSAAVMPIFLHPN